MKRSQLSLEFMLVLAASASFVLALLPVYSQAQEKTRETIVDQTQQSAFERIVSLAKQADTLGKQSLLTAEVKLAAKTMFAFDNSTGVFSMEYSNGEWNKSIREKFAFEVLIASVEFEKGDFLVEAKNFDSIGLKIRPKRI